MIRENKVITNRVSATLTDETVSSIQKRFDDIVAMLPFLINLTSEERRELARLGDKSKAFVDKSLEVARQYPQILPVGLNVDEMQKDVDLFDDLYSLRMKLGNLAQKLDDTLAVTGNEAYTAALTVYGSAKMNGKGLGMEADIEDLAKRFAKQKTTVTQAESTAQTAATGS